MKIKLTESQLKQLIKEEATRYKKVLDLQRKKETILQQLNELYEGDYGMDNNTVAPEIEEGILSNIFGKKDPEQKKQQMRDFIQSHHTFQDVAGFWAEKTGLPENEILEKLVNFFAEEGMIVDGKLHGIKSIQFDRATNEFTNRTKVSAPFSPNSQGGFKS